MNEDERQAALIADVKEAVKEAVLEVLQEHPEAAFDVHTRVTPEVNEILQRLVSDTSFRKTMKTK